MKRWEASKWSPEAAFQVASFPQASQSLVRPLQAPRRIIRPFIWILEQQGGSWCWVWPPRLVLLHLRTLQLVLLAGPLITVKLKELGEASRNWFFILPYKTWAASQQIKGKSLLTSLFFLGKLEKNKFLHFIFSLSARNAKELAGLLWRISTSSAVS